MTPTLKQKFDKREAITGSWISIGHPAVAEVTASSGVDFALLDMEHTAIDLSNVTNIARGVAVAEGDTETMVRVPSHDSEMIQRVLDTGVSGLMFPKVESAAKARRLVKSTRYPPEGERGIAGSRATQYGRNFREYVTNANDDVLLIVQIETRAGLQNAREIGAVDGIDGLFVGPADLSGSLGVFAEYESETFNDAVIEIVESAHDAEVPVGTLTVRSEDIPRRVDQGFDFLIVGKDATYLANGVGEAYDDFRRAVSAQDSTSIRKD